MLFYATLISLIFVAVVLILLILIQKGRGGGLSSAFGGSGGSAAFGAKTGDVLTWATAVIFGIFITLAVTLDLVVGAQYPTTPPTAVNASSGTATATVPPEATLPPMPTMPTTVPAAPTALPTTAPSISSAIQNLGNSLPPPTTAPSTLDNSLNKLQKDINKVETGLKSATKP